MQVDIDVVIHVDKDFTEEVNKIIGNDCWENIEHEEICNAVLIAYFCLSQNAASLR